MKRSARHAERDGYAAITLRVMSRTLFGDLRCPATQSLNAPLLRAAPFVPTAFFCGDLLRWWSVRFRLPRLGGRSPKRVFSFQWSVVSGQWSVVSQSTESSRPPRGRTSQPRVATLRSRTLGQNAMLESTLVIENPPDERPEVRHSETLCHYSPNDRRRYCVS